MVLGVDVHRVHVEGHKLEVDENREPFLFVFSYFVFSDKKQYTRPYLSNEPGLFHGLTQMRKEHSGNYICTATSA